MRAALLRDPLSRQLAALPDFTRPSFAPGDDGVLAPLHVALGAGAEYLGGGPAADPALLRAARRALGTLALRVDSWRRAPRDPTRPVSLVEPERPLLEDPAIQARALAALQNVFSARMLLDRIDRTPMEYLMYVRPCSDCGVPLGSALRAGSREVRDVFGPAAQGPQSTGVCPV